MLKILVADDRSAVYEGLKKLIPWSELDAQIIGEARNGKEALELARIHHPDIVITDVRMPLMDGLTLSKAIHEAMPETIIIILSAYDEFNYAQTALRYGVTDYILKPIDRSKINQIIEKIKDVSLKRQEQNELYSILYNADFYDELSADLKAGQTEGITAFFESAFPDPNKSTFELIKEVCIKLTTLLHETVESLGINPEAIDLAKHAVWEQLLLLKTKAEMKAYIQAKYMKAAQFMNAKKNSRIDAVVEHLKSYILQNYCDPDISVYTIADELGLSANYTSVIFRQVTGENISNFLTKLRMNKARELFQDPTQPIHQISKEIGYMDPHYFARVFKKSEGMTPSQYRNLLTSSESRRLT